MLHSAFQFSPGKFGRRILLATHTEIIRVAMTLDKDLERGNLSRRDFLTRTAVGGAGLMLANEISQGERHEA